MRRPLGCLTFSALVAAILVVLAVLAAAAATGNGIFSPGQLSGVTPGGPIGGVGSHADLGARCDACHAVAGSSDRMGYRCLACHTQVRNDIESRGGLHGRLLATTTNCRDCHTDHRGVTASLTLADPRVFPHEQTGYTLGAHRLREQGGTFGCRDCHGGSLTALPASTCIACHQALNPPAMALHQDAFGAVCLNCHDGVETYGKAYDHATYPLVGGHAGAPCAACHRGATTPAALRATPTECVACHAAKDIHQGRLGASCAECHTTDGWAGASVNHDRTRYPLVGKHVGVLCESCHVDRHWTGIGATCRSCHAAADPHAGKFPGDCGACHTATGWKDATFDHSKTVLPLEGAHAGPTCAACHTNGTNVGAPTTCVGCHAAKDRHKGALGKDCAACHKATTWADVSFDHTTAAYPLTGAHLGVTCQRCHVGGVYKGTSTTCAACHTKTKPASHGGAFGTNCGSCHTTKAWLPATFDHTKAAYPLTGAHLGVTCQRCHVGGVYKGTSTTCAACHTTAKPASHTSSFGTNCGSCHTTRAWLPATYNGPHTFPMDHRGAGGVCSTCHPSTLASYSCSQCHSDSSMTAKHSGVSGFSLTTCASCHPTGRGGD